MTWVYVGIGFAVFDILFILALCRAAGRWDREHQ